MKTSFKITLLSMLILFCFGFVAAFAGTQFQDVFEIQTKEIKNRKKAPPKYKLVRFTHEKHFQDYQIACGSCHHDSENKPLDLKKGDDVARCVTCHTKLEKDKKNKKDIMVLENAMHGNCVGCHKEVNKKSGQKKGPAPTSCSQCHAKAE